MNLFKQVTILTGVSVLLPLVISNNAFSVTHTCSCDIDRLYAGFVGGTGNSAKSKVECENGNSYYLGILDNDLAKTRHSMALASQLADKKLVLQYWSSDGSLNCELANADTSIFPDGMYVE